MTLNIITPEKELFSGEVSLIKVPGKKGPFTIMKKHAPIISTLSQGEIKVVDIKNTAKFFEINGGVVEVNNNKVIIIAE
jgi:F-type H+-transporting ATPase subunit epsilon